MNSCFSIPLSYLFVPDLCAPNFLLLMYTRPSLVCLCVPIRLLFIYTKPTHVYVYQTFCCFFMCTKPSPVSLRVPNPFLFVYIYQMFSYLFLCTDPSSVYVYQTFLIYLCVPNLLLSAPACFRVFALECLIIINTCLFVSLSQVRTLHINQHFKVPNDHPAFAFLLSVSTDGSLD